MDEVMVVTLKESGAECFLCETSVNEYLAGVFMGEVFHIECLIDPSPSLMDKLAEKEI